MKYKYDIERKRKSQARWRENNRAKIAIEHRHRRVKLKREVLEHYGQTCVACGFSDLRALHIDHIANDGNKERARLGSPKFSGEKFYRWLKKQGWPTGYQTLCANCNIIKHAEFIKNGV